MFWSDLVMSFACCKFIQMCVRVRVCEHGLLGSAPLSPTLHHPLSCSYWLLVWWAGV